MSRQASPEEVEFEPPFGTAGATWRVQFDAAGGSLNSGAWTGRAASAALAEAAARFAMDEAWRALTGSEGAMPSHLARSLETQRYDIGEAAKVATRTLGEPLWLAALERGAPKKALAPGQAQAILEAVCASDAAIHGAALRDGVKVAVEASRRGTNIPRKYAHVLVGRILRPGIEVRIGRATEAALMRLLSEVAQADAIELSGPGRRDALELTIARPDGSATLRAAFDANRRTALRRTAPAVAFFRSLGSGAVASGLARQAAFSQEGPCP